MDSAIDESSMSEILQNPAQPGALCTRAASRLECSDSCFGRKGTASRFMAHCSATESRVRLGFQAGEDGSLRDRYVVWRFGTAPLDIQIYGRSSGKAGQNAALDNPHEGMGLSRDRACTFRTTWHGVLGEQLSDAAAGTKHKPLACFSGGSCSVETWDG